MKRIAAAVMLLIATAAAPVAARAQSAALPANGSAAGVAGEPADAPQDYHIGPEDLLEVSVFDVPELSRTVRVSAGGEISLPLIGTVPAAGRSPMQLEQDLTALLKENYVNDPQVSVFVQEYKSDPVSVMGAVKVPGLYQIQTQKTLIEVLAMAQGLSEGPQILPGRTIIITRKQQAPEPSAAPDSSAAPEPAAADIQPASAPANPRAAARPLRDETLEIPIKDLLQSGDPKWNVPVYPGDVVKVVPAGKFYVAGDVNQPGGFALTDYDSVSAIQAVAMAGGTKKTANLKQAVIIRRDAAGNRVEQKIDLKRIFDGKVPDAQLSANDILLVPGSVEKEAALKAAEASINIATGVLIWRP